MKVNRRVDKGRIVLFVVDYDVDRFGQHDPESWKFFEYVSNAVIEGLSAVILERNDGPDASRWVCRIRLGLVYFDFDDMMGMSISIDENDPSSEAILEEVSSILAKL